MQTLDRIDFLKFEDEFGNIVQEFEVIEYDKRANGEWVEEERYNSGRQYYNVDGQIHLRHSNSSIKLNMDFDSETCGRCFKIGAAVVNSRRISGNYELFKTNFSVLGTKKLMRQNYSDGSSFYSLQDGRGNWKVGYGDSDLTNIISQIEREKSIYFELIDKTGDNNFNNVIEEIDSLLMLLNAHL